MGVGPFFLPNIVSSNKSIPLPFPSHGKIKLSVVVPDFNIFSGWLINKAITRNTCSHHKWEGLQWEIIHYVYDTHLIIAGNQLQQMHAYYILSSMMRNLQQQRCSLSVPPPGTNFELWVCFPREAMSQKQDNTCKRKLCRCHMNPPHRPPAPSHSR